MPKMSTEKPSIHVIGNSLKNGHYSIRFDFTSVYSCRDPKTTGITLLITRFLLYSKK